MMGDSFFTNTGADASGRITGKNLYLWYFSKKHQRFPEMITSTAAKFVTFLFVSDVLIILRPRDELQQQQASPATLHTSQNNNDQTTSKTQ